jgi:parallel beta-helix repeat protein
MIDNGSAPRISYNNISDNDFAGIAMLNSSTPAIDHNDITGNLRAPVHTPHGAIVCLVSSPFISNNTLNSNLPGTSGVAAIEINGAGYPNISYNKITNHKGNVNQNGIHTTLANSYIANNLIDRNSNGILLSSGSCVVENNNITNSGFPGNIAASGISFNDFTISTVRNNVITGGTYGVALREACMSSFTGCTISNNVFSAITGNAATTPFINIFTNCTLTGNTRDLALNYTGAAGGTVTLLNTPYDNTSLCITNANSLVEIHWFLHMKTVIESTGAIANASMVRWVSTKGGISFQDLTGPDGWTSWISLKQKGYGATDEKNITYAPYNVTAEKGGLFNYSLVKMDHNYEFTLPLDDILPWVNVAFPEETATVNRTTVNVTGTVEPGCAVTVNTIKGVVGTEGDWYAIVPLGKEGTNVLTVTVVDHGRNQIVRTINVTRDITPPVLTISSPSSDFLVNTTSLIVNGSTDDISGRLFINGVEKPISSNFSYSVDLTAGANTVTIDCADAVWNTATITLRGELDTAPPALVILQPPSLSASTNASSITIKGYTDSDCTVTIDGKPVQLSATENFSASTPLVEGMNDILVVATDKAGNNNPMLLKVLRDSIPPVVSVTYPANNSVVNQSFIELRGTTEAGATIKVNGVLAIPFGNTFSAQVRLDKEGRQVISIDAYDTLKNHIYIEWIVYLDITPPDVKITIPVNNFITNQTAVDIKGRTERGANVTINEEPVTVDASGLFSARVSLDVEGPNAFLILVTDSAGNVGEELTITVIRDTAVQISLINPRNGQKTKWTNLTVSGKTEPGSTVSVQGSSASVRDDGSFSAEVFLAEGPNTITVTVRDKAGNTASTSVSVQKYKASKPPASFIPGFGDLVALAAIGLPFIIRRSLKRARRV